MLSRYVKKNRPRPVFSWADSGCPPGRRVYCPRWPSVSVSSWKRPDWSHSQVSV